MHLPAFHPHRDHPKNQSNIRIKSSLFLIVVTRSVLTGSPSAPGGPWRQVFPADPPLQPTASRTGPGEPGGPGGPGSPFVPEAPTPAAP